MAIANGVFKKVAFAEEDSSNYGSLPTASGVGLTSNAVVGTVSYSAGATAATVATALINATTSGTFLTGQKIKIGSEVFTVTGTPTTSAAGLVTAMTLDNAAVAAATSAQPVLLQSTATATISAPSAAGTTSGANIIGDNNITVTGVTGRYAIGQKFTLAGVYGTVFTVTNTLENATTTVEITFTPALPSNVATGTAITLQSGVTAKYIRRITSNVDMKKATYKSTEIRTDAQRSDFRHGGKSVDGTINGELSGDSYTDFLGAVLRRPFTATTFTPVTTGITFSNQTAVSATLTSSNLFVGIKVGQILKLTANSTTAGWFYGLPVGCHLVVTKVITDGSVITVTIANNNDALTAVNTAANSGAYTLDVVGKTSYIPLTGHVNKSYTIEHQYTDIGLVETFTGCRITQASIKCPATGIVTCDFNVMGQNMLTTGTVLGSPSASNTNSVFSSAVGSIFFRDPATGAAVPVESSLVTAFDVTINGNGTKADVVGSDITPDVFIGSIDVTGNFSVYFTDATVRDYFLTESEIALQLILTTGASSTSASGSTFSIVIPRAKLTSATRDDGEKGLIVTAPFTAILGDGSNGFTSTTIQIFDSRA